jgi:PST family polysaccharide transporter
MLTKIKNIANTEDKKRLLSNFFSLSILQAFTYILPLLTLPYLVRVLGVEKFGLVMFAQSFIMFFNILVDYGFNLSATREVSIYRDDKEKLTEIFSSVMSIKAMLIFISFFILTIVVFSFEKFSNDWELYYLSFLVVIGNAMFPIWYFQGMEKMKYITIVNIASKLIFTILIFVVIQEPSDYLYVPILNGFGFIIGGGISLWIIFKNFRESFILQKISILKKYFQSGYIIFISTVYISFYRILPISILGIINNMESVAIYSIAEKIIRAIISLYQPFVNTFFPYISKQFMENREKALIINGKILKLFMPLILLLILFIIYFSETIVFIFADNKMQNSIVLLQLFSPLLIIVFIANIYGSQTMLHIGMENKF